MPERLAQQFGGNLAAVEDPALRAEWSHYLAYHSRRYAVLHETARDMFDARANPRVLDVGPMFEAALLRELGAHVDTLGFPHPLFPPRDGERHITVELNDAGADGDGSYDLIVMAEVIEHLHSSPVAVLESMVTWLAPGGELLLQTPNAVALHKRLRMLAGRNPIEPIRRDPSNPGHFHEYTLGELRDAAAAAGLAVSGWRADNYFGAGPAARAYAGLGRVLPPSLRHGITIWMKRSRPPPGLD